MHNVFRAHHDALDDTRIGMRTLTPDLSVIKEELSMSPPTKLMTGKLLLSIVAVFTIVSPYVADWNASHIYNPLWTPHAKFHNAQTMAVAVLLGSSSLFFLWRKYAQAALLIGLLTGDLLASLYWASQVIAFLYPGVAWTDPNLLQPNQSLSDVPIQLKGDLVLFAVVAIATWLLVRGTGEGVLGRAKGPHQLS
jgi:hypothetical protein